MFFPTLMSKSEMKEKEIFWSLEIASQPVRQIQPKSALVGLSSRTRQQVVPKGHWNLGFHFFLSLLLEIRVNQSILGLEIYFSKVLDVKNHNVMITIISCGHAKQEWTTKRMTKHIVTKDFPTQKNIQSRRSWGEISRHIILIYCSKQTF